MDHSSVLVDPLFLLHSWNYNHETPCSWRGVSCNNDSQVVTLSLPNSQLLGSIPSDLGSLKTLQSLDLSNNSFNGPLPVSFFNATELRLLDLSSNMISGEVPAAIGDLHSLLTLNLSDNALAGKLPANLVTLRNLTVVSLDNNYFSGQIPGGWRAVQFLDLSSNLINGSLPPDFGGECIRYLNVSFNQISGEIPPEIGAKFPRNATIDLSFNNLTGSIPNSPVFLNQESNFVSGNPGLCGDPTRNPCPITSSPSIVSDADAPTSTPAIAAIPNTIGSTPVTDPTTQQSNPNPRTGLRPGVIIGIVLGDIAGISILAVIFLYIYRCKKNMSVDNNINNKQRKETADTITLSPSSSSSSSPDESRRFAKWSCLRKDPETTPSDEEEDEETGYNGDQRSGDNGENKQGTLVTVDGEKEMEIETLLKASAYILGATGSSIMYKAVLEDGAVFAVRRLGENGPTPSPSPSSVGPLSPYCAPETFRSLKPSPKWDVFGFGVILLELLTGKIVSAEEIGLGNGLTVEEGHRALRMADVVIRGELEGKEDFLLSCFKLGFSCASPVPQKRPTMKESLAVLERFPHNSSVVYVVFSCLSQFDLIANLLRLSVSSAEVSEAERETKPRRGSEITGGAAMESKTTAVSAADDLQSSDGVSSSSSPADAVARLTHALSQRQQHLLDKTVPHVLYRWISCLVVVLIYAVRVYFVEGFYIITYAIGIYILNLLIAFLSPQEDPEASLGGGSLPTRGSDEFRPFVRRLPEFKVSITRAFVIGFVMTFFQVFDVPAFWPILLFYWVMLFFLTMRKQIQHMIKYRYVPFSFGKQRYGKKTPSMESSDRPSSKDEVEEKWNPRDFRLVADLC
ncbi:unnamed protein product [Thlaspi arvense]|uniref:Leucine-rich repeat-containing N-terminal plant-type domain-containing protein n=1 Tax=Thlaspi arvense TaxID=13288 RepID=A0AAU9T058_THLAR|nr:unnamed protein product [Thlaspi arvense]